MLKIYANADRVIIWLGPHADDSHLAMSMVNFMNEKANRELIFTRHHSLQCLDQLKRSYRALGALYSRPWFSRVWIWQEVMVAKDIIVWCGTSRTYCNALKRMARRLHRIRHILKCHV